MTNLKKARLLAEITQKEAAEYLGITQTTYCKYERNKIDIPLSKAVKLAKLYKKTIDALIE